MVNQISLKQGYGICPVCNGSLRAKPKHPGDWSWCRGFNKEDGTLPCFNCKTQGMFTSGEPTGQVILRSDGTPCTHEYVERQLGRCYYRYTCKHCISSYEIDSGD